MATTSKNASPHRPSSQNTNDDQNRCKNEMKFISAMLVLLSAAICSVALAQSSEQDQGRSDVAARTNIIVILVDDMGFSDLGCYGSEIPTPHLDDLAKQGAKFSRFYNTGRCCPTRASLLTGLYSHQAGVGHMTAKQDAPGYQGRLNQNCVTIGQVLQGSGYFTMMTGKWHVGFDDEVNPSSKGFDRSLNLPAGGIHFSDQTGSKGGASLYLNGQKIDAQDSRLNPPWYGADLWTDQGIRFIDEAQKAGKPFFWYLAHTAPHFPCMAPEATIAKYRGKFMQGWDELSRQRHQRQVESGLIHASWKQESRPDEVPAWETLSDPEKERYDHMMAIYAAMIEEVDKNIGKLVDALRSRNQLDNTLILFMSDNGGNAEAGVKGKYEGDNPGDAHSNVFIGQSWAHLNNTPFRLYKHYNHEGGIASPLIAHWPAAMTGRSNQASWINAPTHLIDIMATCVDVGAAKYPEEWNGHKITPLQGQSLKSLLTGKGEFPSRNLYWEHEGNAAIREGEHKLVRKGAGGQWELFDLKNDRTEQFNLAAENPDQVTQLAADWKTWAKAAQVLPKPTAGNPKVKRGKKGKAQPKTEAAK
jgi:arylsulfatase A-like enzyme